MRKIRLTLIIALLLTIVSCNYKKDKFYSYVKGQTGITGLVTYNRKAMEAVEVYLYRNTISNLRGPADFLDVTNNSGGYFIDVPEGEYYIIARKRKSGATSGPIKKGDYYSDPIYEPIVVKRDHIAIVDLKLRQLIGAMIQKSEGQKKTDTSISGLILDEEGKAVKGVYAFAYKDDDIQREPDYFSNATNANGEFIIYFEEGGRYNLGARSSSRGEPKVSELYGLYEGARGSGVFVKNKENIIGIKIILKSYKK